MEEIMQKIADKLAEIMPTATIYTENQTSGFEVPSFYIQKVMTRSKPRTSNIQDRTVTYQVVYFANPDSANADLDKTESLLLDNFTRLGDYATVRNREFNTDTKEETLTMIFDLLLNMYKIEDIPKQRKVDINERQKENDR